jgi:predicted metal-dependent phosphoesterase TrpH
MIIKKLWLIFFLGIVFNAHGKWLKGDLHNHSSYSDGANSVSEVIKAAKNVGFDFLAITDHDSWMNGIPLHWQDPDYRDEKITLLYGIEWTTYKGHANILSHEKFEYEKLWMANQQENVQMAVDASHQQKALFSINHPEMLTALKYGMVFIVHNHVMLGQ